MVWAASALREDFSTCSSEESPAGWHKRAWHRHRSGSSHACHLWWKWAASSFHNWHWQNNPGAAWSTVALSAYCQHRWEDQLHAAMSEVPIEAHKPLKLHVLQGTPNTGLQSFEKAEFLDNYLNQISESFEDGLSLLRGPLLQGTVRSYNCLTSCSNFTVCFAFSVLLSPPQKLGIPMCWLSEVEGTRETTWKPWGESSFPFWVWEFCSLDTLPCVRYCLLVEKCCYTLQSLIAQRSFWSGLIWI